MPHISGRGAFLFFAHTLPPQRAAPAGTRCSHCLLPAARFSFTTKSQYQLSGQFNGRFRKSSGIPAQ
uniref:Putative secreted protein n=1 Tax=Anopheles triannulatus TaxID=58253 RepID=A0A2M4B7D9_9DIPT